MASTRTRLTVSYLVVVTATLVAFAIALYVARGAEADQDVLEQAASLADDVLATIRNAQLAGKRLTYQEQTEGLPTIRASQEMGEQLDRHPGYFLVLDSLGRLLFSSNAVRLLAADDQQELYSIASRLLPGGPAARLALAGDSLIKGRLMLVARRDPAVGPHISRVIGGVPTDVADGAPHFFVGALVALAPVILDLPRALPCVLRGRTCP